jgi:hypothetical protein
MRRKYNRFLAWVGDWVDLAEAIIRIVTFTYVSPAWSFRWTVFVIRRSIKASMGPRSSDCGNIRRGSDGEGYKMVVASEIRVPKHKEKEKK